MRYKIFLIDDDEDDRDLFEDAISELPFQTEIDTFANGLDLFEYLGAGHPIPHLIFMDFNMPVLNGADCLLRIRSEKRLLDIPLIVYSTIIVDSIAKRLSESGANQYLQKPSSFQQLKSMLELCITNVLNINGKGQGKLEFVFREM